MKSYLKITILLISIFIISGVQMAFACGDCPPPPPCQKDKCRVTAGGVDISTGSWDQDLPWGQFKKTYNRQVGWDRYTFGGQAGAPDSLHGEWTHHNKTGISGSFVFHAGTSSAPDFTWVSVIRCWDEPGCSPSGNPPSPFKQIEFHGVGTFKNAKDLNIPFSIDNEHGHYFWVHMSDLGEPGKSGRQNAPGNCPADGFMNSIESGPEACKCADYYYIEICPTVDACDTEDAYMVEGYIKGGNLQIHSALD